MTTDTIDRAALKERAIYLTVESLKADWAGARGLPVHFKQAAAMDAAVTAGIPLHEMRIEAEDQFIAYLYASREPGYQPVIDYQGDGQPVAA